MSKNCLFSEAARLAKAICDATLNRILGGTLEIRLTANVDSKDKTQRCGWGWAFIGTGGNACESYIRQRGASSRNLAHKLLLFSMTRFGPV
jgi:hypothetical protein